MQNPHIKYKLPVMRNVVESWTVLIFPLSGALFGIYAMYLALLKRKSSEP
jgi:hypothetical protein